MSYLYFYILPLYTNSATLILYPWLESNQQAWALPFKDSVFTNFTTGAFLGVTGYRTLFSWFTVKRFTNKLETPYTLKVGLEPTKSAPSLDGSVYQFHHFSFVPTTSYALVWEYLWDILDH